MFLMRINVEKALVVNTNLLKCFQHTIEDVTVPNSCQTESLLSNS